MLNILVAYPYMKKNVVETLYKNQKDIRFILDSGAFTAWKAGKSISIDDYCAFIESLPFKPWRYFNLDVIGDGEKSFKNYKIMLERGFNPVPVFTRGEDVKMIDEYYKTSDVLAIGGLVGTEGNKGFVKGIMKIIGNRKVHWLGFTEKNFITHYKPYMCDSSSVLSGARYGTMTLYFGKGVFKNFKKTDFINKPDNQIINALSNLGIDIFKLKDSNEWRGSTKNLIGEVPIKSWVKYQNDIRINFKTNLFIALASDLDLNSVIKGYFELKQLGAIKNES